jgi:hypothetical protein
VSFVSIFSKETVRTKIYIPSTINTEKGLLITAIWADRKWAGFWQVTLNLKQYRNIDFNPEFSIKFRMNFHPKNLKSERNNL